MNVLATILSVAVPVCALSLPAAGQGATSVCEYWAGRNQDGHARNAGAITLEGALHVRWAHALTNFNEISGVARAPYAGQRGNTLAIRQGRVLALVPGGTNPLAAASSAKFATFGTFSLATGTRLHETITSHLGGGTRGGATLQDSDTTYGLVNYYWNSSDMVFTAFGSDSARAFGFDAFTGTLPPGSPYAAMAQAPNGSGYFSMTDDNPLIYARGALNTHGSFSKGRGGLLGSGETVINSMKHYAPFLVSGWQVFAFTMTNTTEDASFPSGLGTVITDYAFTNAPYGASIRWQAAYPSNTFAGFGLHHVRGAPRPLALGTDGRIYYYGFRNVVSGGIPTAPDYAAGMRLFAVSASSGAPLFEISTGWNPAADPGLASSSWGTQLYHHMLPQISVAGSRVVVFHPEVNQGYTTNLWTRGRLFCFDTAATGLLWSVNYTAGTFNAKLRLDDVVYNASNNQSPNSMWGDNTEQAIQVTISGDHAYLVDPGIVGGSATGALQLTVYRYALADGAATVTNLVPVDANANPIVAIAERMVNGNDNTNRVALRELAAVDGALVALVDIDLCAQALVAIEGVATPAREFAPAAAIHSPFAGIPPALQSFNDHRLKDTAPVAGIPVLNRAGSPGVQLYDTGTPVPFDASGSVDPDGGALAYLWRFGDGATGTGAATTHTYAAWGGAPAVSNMTVRLTVIDDEGHTGEVSRVIQVRDVGGSSLTRVDAREDSYVYTAGANANSNYGSSPNLEVRRLDSTSTQEMAYLKFDLTGVDVAAVADAVLRVLVTTPKEFLLEAYTVSNGWTEATVKGVNAPPPGECLGDARVTQYDEVGSYTRAFYQWIEFPVLSHVRDGSQGVQRSFVLATTNVSASSLVIASRSSSLMPGCAPHLVLRSGATGYAAPSITAAPPATVVYTNSVTRTLELAATSAVGASRLTYSWWQVSGPRRSHIAIPHGMAAGGTPVTIPAGGGTYLFCGQVDDGMQPVERRIRFQEEPLTYFTLSAGANNPLWGNIVPTGGLYAAGETVLLNAQANPYYHFQNWTGEVSGMTASVEVVMTTDRTVAAVFAETLVTNGTPQWWLAANGLPVNDAGALGDGDGDGASSWQEYLAGTDPTNTTSVLRITNTWRSPAGWGFAWPVSSGKVYSVLSSTNLAGEGYQSLLSNSFTGLFTSPVPAGAAAKFYTIEVKRNP